MSTTRVLLVDDHAVVRAGCRQLLERHGGYAVAEAGSAAEALRLAGEQAPRLVVLDLNLPDKSGFEVLGELRHLAQPPRVLVFTMHEDPGHATRALAEGAHGYVTKTDAPEVFLEAVRRVAEGEVYLSHPIAQKFALAKLNLHSDPLEALTRREREVFNLIGQGKSLSDIADYLKVSYKTAANISTQVKRKLNVSSSAELIRLSIKNEAG